VIAQKKFGYVMDRYVLITKLFEIVIQQAIMNSQPKRHVLYTVRQKYDFSRADC
jgi:hypothetical protein